MRSIRVPRGPLAGLLFLVLSCGPSVPPVTWQITPSSSAAVNDGNTPTTVAATITSGGQPVPDGTQVSFSLSTSSAASFAPVVPGTANNINTGVSTTSGVATVQIYDLAVETVTIDLTADVNFTTASATVTGTTTVHFGGSCPDSQVTAPIPANSHGSGIPAHISFTCTDPVMGGVFAFDQNKAFENNTQVCNASVSDANQQAVTNAAVQFLTEAGAIETDVAQYGQHPTMLTDTSGVAAVNFTATPPYPEDVPYNPANDGYFDPCPEGQTIGCDTEPRMWTDSSGHTYNPSDGWVAIIAATPGVLPAGSPSIPEPYVDSNHNGQYDPGEPYLDVNCNGQFDATQKPDANGFVRIWSQTIVVWTDQLYPPPSVQADPAAVQAGVVAGDVPSAEVGCSGTLQPGGTCSSLARFVDINANLPGDLGSGNVLNFTVQSGACAMVIAPNGDEAIDLGYSVVQLATTDFPYSVTNTSPDSPPMGTSGYGAGVQATLNFVDTSVQQTGNFEGVTTITYGLGLVSGNCSAPQ